MGSASTGRWPGPGADWALVGPDGWARVDVRGQILTDDGAVIFVTYGGVLELNEKVMVTMAAGDQETAFDDQYFRITPCLETGDARYAWVNQAVFIARGRLVGGGVMYEVYRAT